MKFRSERKKILLYGAAACLSLPHPGNMQNDPCRKNVKNQELQLCGQNPMTGYYRDGYCASGPEDSGVHVVCAKVTDRFLKFSRERGNDLITPVAGASFPGLKAGDLWCLCAARWKEALQAGAAPAVNLDATHVKALDFVELKELKEHQIN